jgi:hypothetical protein
MKACWSARHVVSQLNAVRETREKECIASDQDIGKSDHTIVEDDIAILSTSLPEGKHPKGKGGHASAFASTTSTR